MDRKEQVASGHFVSTGEVDEELLAVFAAVIAAHTERGFFSIKTIRQVTASNIWRLEGRRELMQ